MRDVPLDVSGLRTNDHVEFRGLRFEVSYVDPSIEPTRRVIHLTRFMGQYRFDAVASDIMITRPELGTPLLS